MQRRVGLASELLVQTRQTVKGGVLSVPSTEVERRWALGLVGLLISSGGKGSDYWEHLRPGSPEAEAALQEFLATLNSGQSGASEEGQRLGR